MTGKKNIQSLHSTILPKSLQTFLNFNFAGIFILDQHGYIIATNSGVHKNFGYTVEFLKGKHFSIVYSELDQRKGIPENEWARVNTAGIAAGKFFIQHSNGSILYAEGECVRINEENKTFVVKIVLNMERVHELEGVERKLNEQLRQQGEDKFKIEKLWEHTKKRLDLALAAGLLATYIWYFKEEVFIPDPCLAELLEVPCQPISMETFLNLIHPEDVKKVEHQLEETITSGKIYEAEYRIKTVKKHQYKWIMARGKMEYDQNHHPMSLSGFLIDITDKKTYETQLEKLNRELNLKNIALSKVNSDLDNFIYTASHDLKAPISNIEGLLLVIKEGIEDKISGQDPIRELLDLMGLSIDRFKKTIKDLSNIAQVDTLALEDNAIVSFHEVLEGIKKDIQDLILISNTTIKEDFSKKASIHFSSKNFRSIMYNLISNAIKYAHPLRSPVINICSYESGDYTVLQVEDNGLGIAKDDFPKVYKMYQRLHTHVEGSGMGMAIVKKIMDNAGGKVEIESEVGKGTTFRIYFK